MHTIRPYNKEVDYDAAVRIWREVGWFDGSPEQQEAIGTIIETARANVAELAGAAECLVLTRPGIFRYLEEDLPASIVADVTTSRVARKQGLASRTTAISVAQDASEGALVSTLGMFDQGYYNQIGFGTGSYELWVAFDPAQLKVSARPRAPRRLTRDDAEAVHALRLARVRTHGAVSIPSPAVTLAEMTFSRNGFGLGYRDGPGGALSHCLWCGAENVGRGPYQVHFLAYQTGEQFLELMALLKSLGDQVRLVRMVEPPGVQMQSLMVQPFKQRQLTEKGPFETGIRAVAWWQIRICDLPGCLARTHLTAGPLRFNLRLSDPIERYLPADAPWRGVAGDYVVELGPSSGAERGTDPSLPTLTATVNAFTRLWIGVAPATGLAVTDELTGPPELLEALDRVLNLPTPLPDWRY